MPEIVRRKRIVSGTLREDEVLWRYLDMAKFMDLMESQCLFFSRGDQFEDKFEGAFSHSMRGTIEGRYNIGGIDIDPSEFRREIRKRVYINCWRSGRNDSMAMWRLYGRSPTALAITTTVQRLRTALELAGTQHDFSIQRVRYVNHWRNPTLDIQRYSDLFGYKVKAYSYEREVRIIIDKFSSTPYSDTLADGMMIKLSMPHLLRSIVVSPEAQSWFFRLVKSVVQRYGVEVPIRRSMLTFDPP